MRKTGLGRGLDALLPQGDDFLETTVRDLPIADIDPNSQQPRREFDKDALEQLSQSIRAAGVLQPILVVQKGSRYQIVAGERRFRAARMAGLETVPCIVRDLTQEQQMAAALIENLQREDLNPIEEAAAIQMLIKECGYTQEQAADKLGKSRSALTNLLRLLTLPSEVIELVKCGKLSAGHARVLVGIAQKERQLELAKECVERGYSVRTLEELSGQEKAPEKAKKTPRPQAALPAELSALQDAMRETLGVKTTLTGNDKKGKILLTYNCQEELEHIFEVVGRMATR